MFYLKIVFILLSGFCFLSYGQGQDKVLFYVGTFSGNGAEGIYLCNFDTVTGNLGLENKFKGYDNPNFLTKSKDGRYLYACIRPEQAGASGNGAVAAFKINREDGALSFINQQSSEGVDPCYVDITPDNKYVAVANYGDGIVSLFKTEPDGSLGKATQVIQHSGSGPNERRQAGPHAHSVRFSPFDNNVFAADLGNDNLMIYDFNETEGKLTEGQIPFTGMEPGSGPRHFDFHPEGKFIYVVNELGSTVSIVSIENNYKVIQTISTLPAGYGGINYCADIHISACGKFLYCSNRGHNSITTFRVDEGGFVEWIAVTPSNGQWPRNFTVAPGENFLLVANQNSNNISVFRINRETGIPVYIRKEIQIPSPVCLVF